MVESQSLAIDTLGHRLRRWTDSARRRLASVRLRIVVAYVVLVALTLVVAIVLTRQIQLARADREIELEQAQEVEELRKLAVGRDPETGEPFGHDVESILLTFLNRNVPSDDEAFYTIVDGRGFRFSNESPPLFNDPQFLQLWSVSVPTASTTTTDVDGIGEVRSLAVPIVAGDRVLGVFVKAVGGWIRQDSDDSLVFTFVLVLEEGIEMVACIYAVTVIVDAVRPRGVAL